jgi:hypothetical protein
MRVVHLKQRQVLHKVSTQMTHHHARPWFYAMVILLLFMRHSDAQTSEVQVGLRPENFFFTSGAHTYNIFGPVDSIQLRVSIVNDDPARMLFLEGGFFDALMLNVTRIGADRLPITVEWVPYATCPGGLAPGTECAISFPIRLDGLESVMGSATLRAQGAVFPPGEYQIGIDTRGAKALIRQGDTSLWSGTMIDTGSIPLTILPIRDERDRRTFRHSEANYASARRDFNSAARQYRQLLTDDPNDLDAVTGLGMTLVRLGRFADAVPLFERALPTLGSHSRIPGELALAYVALGDEPKAEALLRRYYSTDTIRFIRDGIRRKLSETPKSAP